MVSVLPVDALPLTFRWKSLLKKKYKKKSLKLIILTILGVQMGPRKGPKSSQKSNRSPLGHQHGCQGRSGTRLGTLFKHFGTLFKTCWAPLGSNFRPPGLKIASKSIPKQMVSAKSPWPFSPMFSSCSLLSLRLFFSLSLSLSFSLSLSRFSKQVCLLFFTDHGALRKGGRRQGRSLKIKRILQELTEIQDV